MHHCPALTLKTNFVKKPRRNNSLKGQALSCKTEWSFLNPKFPFKQEPYSGNIKISIAWYISGFDIRTDFCDIAKKIRGFPGLGEGTWGGFSGCIEGGNLHQLFFKKNFWLCQVAYGILVPQPGIEPAPPALAVQILNQWTTRKVPQLSLDISGGPTSRGLKPLPQYACPPIILLLLDRF